MKDLYKKQLIRYITELSSRTFSNSNKDLYQLLLLTILKYSSSNIKWLIPNYQKINVIVDNEVLTAIKDYAKEKSIEIYFLESGLNKKKNKFLDLKADNLKVYVINNKDIKYNQEILIWDNHGYRFAPDGRKYTAICCANDEQFTQKCNLIFQKLLKNKAD